MTRKDFEAVASSLVVARKVIESFPGLYTPEVTIDLITELLAERFMQDNERFNYKKFMEAAKEVVA